MKRACPERGRSPEVKRPRPERGRTSDVKGPRPERGRPSEAEGPSSPSFGQVGDITDHPAGQHHPAGCDLDVLDLQAKLQLGQGLAQDLRHQLAHGAGDRKGSGVGLVDLEDQMTIHGRSRGSHVGRDIAGSEALTEFGGTGGFDTSDAVFSPDGQYLAADLATGIFLWRVPDNNSIWEAYGNSLAVAFSPDGQYLAYTNVDDGNKVFLSSPDGERTIRIIDSTQGPVWELIFSPDSSMLAATDGIEIRIWHIPDGELLFVGKMEGS